ncbi:MAG: hypothetical protein AAFO83_00275, partial [Cyanobacteria bacterium J06607_13]
VPSSITQYVQGGGFSGTGEIKLIAISSNFSPLSLSEIKELWIAESGQWDTAGSFPVWKGSKGDFDLAFEQGNTPSFSSSEGVIVFAGSGMQLVDADTGAERHFGNSIDVVRWMMTVVMSIEGGTHSLWSSGQASTAFINRNGHAFDKVRIYQGTNFNGELDSGDVIYRDGDVGYVGDTGTVPTGTPFIIVNRILPGGNNGTGSANNASINKFAQTEGNVSTRLDGKVVATMVATSEPSEADVQLCLRWGGALLLAQERGLTNPLVSNFPDRGVIPTIGSGSAASITATVPVVSYDRIVSGAPVGCAITIFERSRSKVANRSQFTLAAGNASGNSTLVVNETIPADVRASGHIRVLRDDGTEDRLPFSSRDGSIFTLDSVTLPVTYSSGNGCYVGVFDVLGSATGTETVSLQHVANRDCVLSIRLGSGPSRIIDINQDITLGASDFEFQVSAIADGNNSTS